MYHLRDGQATTLLDVDYAGVALEQLTKVVGDTEVDHAPVREQGLEPVACRCGESFDDTDDRFAAYRGHVRRAVVAALVGALTGPCDTCRGRGVWTKMAGTLPCPDCDGSGETLLPLPAMHFRDREGAVWQVMELLDDTRAVVSKRDWHRWC